MVNLVQSEVVKVVSTAALYDMYMSTQMHNLKHMIRFAKVPT